MKFEIKHRWDGSVLFSLETSSLRLCVEAAVKAKANLSDADLSAANLSAADLSHADLSHADLSHAEWGFKADPELPKKVAASILNGADGPKVDMTSWHQCDTVHCMGGWAIHHSGPAGYALESIAGSAVAATMLMPSAAHMFYKSNDEAIAWAKQQLEIRR